MPLGLFLVAFPPPPVTFPATRLAACLPKKPHIERRRTLGLIISVGRHPFLSGRPRPAGLPTLRKLFGFRLPTYWTAAFRSFCPRTVRHRVRPSFECRSKLP